MKGTMGKERSENKIKLFRWPLPQFVVTKCEGDSFTIEIGRYWHWADLFLIFFTIAWIYTAAIPLINLEMQFHRIPFSVYFFIVIPALLWPPVATVWNIISLFYSRWRIQFSHEKLLLEKKKLIGWKAKAQCGRESLRGVTCKRCFGGEYKIKIEADSRISIANIASRESADWLTRLITSWKHAAFEDVIELVRNYKVSL